MVVEEVEALDQGGAEPGEHIGEIESCDFNLMETSNDEDPTSEVYDIKGSKGSGRVRIITDDDDFPISGTLILPDGREIDIKLFEEELEEEEAFDDAADGIDNLPEPIPENNDK